MARYHIVHGSTGLMVMVTDDPSGKKLPKRPVGKWLYFRPIELNRGDKARIGASSDEVIDAIERDGYFKWPQEKRKG